MISVLFKDWNKFKIQYGELHNHRNKEQYGLLLSYTLINQNS